MKKQNRYHRSLYMIPLGVTALFFSSCLKNNGYYNDFSQIRPAIEMPLAAKNTNLPFALALTIADTPSTYPVYVNVASLDKPGAPVTATLGVDSAYLNQYNAEKLAADPAFKPYELLPDSTYQFERNVTVPAKERLAYSLVQIFTNKIKSGHKYVLPVTITQSSLPLSNWNHLLINVTTKNQWDGIYTMFGATNHPTNPALAGPFGPLDMALITTGPNVVTYGKAHPWANGSGSALPAGYEAVLTVDPATNKVTIQNSIFGDQVLNSPGYDSHYDPATKTFYLGWQYAGGGGNRVFIDTLVYKKAR